MGSVGAPEILVILVLALIVLGPDRLPQAARTLGHWVGELRRLTGSLQAEVQGVVDEVMRPVNETATVATGAFTSNFTAGETGLVDNDGAATTASPSAATAEPASGSAPTAPLAADVPLPGVEPRHSFPVPPVDPSLN
ncbi:MAG: twin-arginine translocase TatA/TatE family subunit [Acidimicrobiales bacterium]